MPTASWSWTTAAISRATSAGPKPTRSASISTAAVQPTPSAVRSCSTASSGPRVSTVAVPPPASAIFTASSTAQLSCGLTVNPTNRASTDCASAVSSTSPDESGTRFTHTRTLVIL